MARKTSTELFELVKAMTPSEKRYLKLFTSLHTVGAENKYMKLFDLMDQMEVYDENVLIKGVNDKGGVTFSKLKKYLYDLILKAMRNFNTDKNGTHQLTAAIDDISILFNKGLYVQSQKAINKAEKIISEYDLLSYNFLIDNWKRRVNLHIDAKRTAQVGSLNGKLDEFNELNEQMEAFGQIQEFTRSCSAITADNELPKYVVEKMKFQPKKIASAKVRFFNLRIKSIYFRLNRDFNAYLKVSKEAYDLANYHSAFKNEDVLIYTLEPLLEYCNALLNNRQFADFRSHIKKTTPYIIASKLTITAEGRANIDAFVNLMKSEYDRQNGNYKNFTDHVNTIKTIKSDQSLHPSPALKNLYYWELINWYFRMGELNNAVVVIEKMKRDIPNYQTIQAAIAVKWICQYEQKSFQDLEIDVNRNNNTSELENLLAQTFNEQLQNETMGKWMKLKNDLCTLKVNPKEHIHFKYFDFVGWVNNKMLNDSALSTPKKQMHYYHH
ncbi:MAG: hypothetical protein ACPGLV_10540 [Bacteroidia bacterium]